MKNPRRRVLLIFGAISFFVGVMVLFLSLLAVSPAYRSVNGMRLARRLYIGEILPDHVFYPVVNLLQKRTLDAAGEVDRPWLELAVAQDRLNDAMKVEEMNLGEREEVEMTITLMSKAHQYMAMAVESLGRRLENNELTEEQKIDFKVFVNETEQKMLDLQKRLPEADRGEVASILLEAKLTVDKINRQLEE